MGGNLNLAFDARSADIYRRAALGDLAAQRQLADFALQTFRDANAKGGESNFAVVEALLWARLAAAQGEAADGMRLSEALAHAASIFGAVGLGAVAESLTVESLAILHALASAGNAAAASNVATLTGNIAPAISGQARTMAARWGGFDAQDAHA